MEWLLYRALHFLKQFLGDERRHGVLEDDARVAVFAEIDAVGERVEHAVVGDGLAVGTAAPVLLADSRKFAWRYSRPRSSRTSSARRGRKPHRFKFMVDDLIAEGNRAAVSTCP